MADDVDRQLSLAGPDDLELVLDRTQIFPADPGRGTPAIVRCGPYSSTYWCAVGAGELLADRGGGVYTLTAEQRAWLDEQQAAIDEFLPAV